jgi:hypothetical protein
VPPVTSTTSPELSWNSWSAGTTTPFTVTVPTPIALKVPGCDEGGGGSGGRYLAPRDGVDGNEDRNASRPAARPAPAPRPAPKASTGFDDMDDDIPF